MPCESADSLVTDPPAGIGFMGKEWDHHKGGRDQWVGWMTSVMRECNRVLKPGAHGLVWALPRTSHWTATALEDAGFEIRDVVTHLFGTGFPKSMDVSKAIDKAAGAEREVVGKKGGRYATPINNIKGGNLVSGQSGGLDASSITAPATPEAKQWDGWGTALKPANEHWILVRKPLGEKTVAKNVLKHGTGGINVDGCRVETEEVKEKTGLRKSMGYHGGDESSARHNGNGTNNPQGRFPANLIVSGEARDVLDEQSGVSPSNFRKQKGGTKAFWNSGSKEVGPGGQGDSGGASRFFFDCGDIGHYPHIYYPYPVADKDIKKDACHFCLGVGLIFMHDGEEEWETECHLCGGSGNRSAPFLYCAKASKRERNAGVETGETKANGARPNSADMTGKFPDHDQRPKTGNHHPTVKAQKLMRYLTRMVTPPGGVVLDPFMGSGSTGVACVSEGFKFIGIEAEKEYIEIARARIDA